MPKYKSAFNNARAAATRYLNGSTFLQVFKDTNLDQVKFPKQTGNCGVHASSTWCWMDGGYTIGALSDNQARTGSTLTSNATFFL